MPDARTRLDDAHLQRRRHRFVQDQVLATEVIRRVDAPQASFAEALLLGETIVVVERVGGVDGKRLHPKTLVGTLR